MPKEGKDIIDYKEASTLWGLFCERSRQTPDHVAYRAYDPTIKDWCDYPWRAVKQYVDRYRAALGCEALAPGDRVALLLPNGIDWVCFDIAAHALGLVVVGLYPNDSPGNHAYILGHSDARLLLLDTPARWDTLAPLGTTFPALESVWIREWGHSMTAPAAPSVRSLVDILESDASVPPAVSVASNVLATLIYTSGTMGKPKGVMLSHFALLWNAAVTGAVIPPRLDDLFLSILPLAHAFERTVGDYLPMLAGSTVAFARSAKDLQADVVALRPTVMLGVPHLYERLRAAATAGTRVSAIRRLLVHLAASVGWRRIEGAHPSKRYMGLADRLLWPLLAHLVVAPLMASLGGRLRVAVSGGARLGAPTARFLAGLGLPIVEGYGLTEAAPVVAAGSLDDNMPGSVGRPLPGVEVRLSARNELLVRSPAVMMGYWKDEAATAQVLDSAGWLSTGDLAEIHDGRIFITGRIDDILVLTTGEKINPNAIEAEIDRETLFEQVAVVGDGKPFLAAIIVLNKAAWSRFADENNFGLDLLNAPPTKTKILGLIKNCLSGFPHYAQVHAVHLTLKPWTVNDGLLTPTLKVKRYVLQQMFSKEIESLYERQLSTDRVK